VLTQFLSVSLHRHIRQTYRFDVFGGGFVEILAAQQTPEFSTDWYQGTADAVRKNLRYVEYNGNRYVLILSGDQLYRMDYRKLINDHVRSKADVTIAAVPVARERASDFGIVQFDEDGRVTGFVEKPKTDADQRSAQSDPAWLNQHGLNVGDRTFLANMGIYLFNFDVLHELLDETEHEDFGRQVFPDSIRKHRVQVHLFDGYWEDIGTIRSFYDANLQTVQPNPPFELLSKNAPIYTRPRFLPPTRFGSGTIRHSLIADGCEIGSNVTIENSIIGQRCRVGDGAVIRNSIIMGADAFDSSASGETPTGIGPHCVVEGAIVDKMAKLGQGVSIRQQDAGDADRELEGCVIRDGIPVVVKDATLPRGWALT
jgi:glucose-1-phosphate adenylyltransferase